MTPVSDVVKLCPYCKAKPNLWEETFFGYAGRRFKVECPKCMKRTEYQRTARTAVSKWNGGHYIEQRTDASTCDNEGLVELLGAVTSAAYDDYILLASKDERTQTSGDLHEMKQIEEFFAENPYALPYNGDFIIEKMKAAASEKREKSTSLNGTKKKRRYQHEREKDLVGQTEGAGGN